MAGQDESAERSLRLIADLLGISVAQLRDGLVPAEFADTDECLRLWYQLKTDAARAAALAALRRVVEEVVEENDG